MKILTGSFLIVVIAISITIPLVIHFLKEDFVPEEDDEVDRDEIVILNDEDFVKYNFTGTGTKNDPYIIEDYTITDNPITAITVNLTTKYFVIRNCTVDANKYGILISEVAEGTASISNNYCGNQNYGIFVTESHGTLIENNICNNNANSGIVISSCSDSIIRNNTCLKNRDDGITVESSFQHLSSNNTLSDNLCKENGEGIDIRFSEKTNLINNTCVLNSLRGMRLDYNSEINLIQNNCSFNYYDGMNIWDDNENVTIAQNYIQGHNWGILLYADNCIVANNTFAYNWYGLSISRAQNVTVYGNNCSRNTNGIALNSDNGAIYENVFYNNDVGLKLEYLEDTIITNNYFYNGGIFLGSENIHEPSSTMVIENNWLNGKEIGYFYEEDHLTINESIYGQIILVFCTNSIITNQNFTQSGAGIRMIRCYNITNANNTCFLAGGFDGVRSSELHFYNNTCLSAGGMHFDRCSEVTIVNNTINYGNFALYIYICENYTVTNNTLNYNYMGIFLSGSQNCLFKFNMLRENENEALRDISGVGMNYIYLNSFIDNNLGEISQAYDHFTPNIWYNSTLNLGNYWSDWSGIGPYIIDGEANATDPYPLNNPIYP